MQRFFDPRLFVLPLLLIALGSGCGGNSASTGSQEQVQQFGDFTARAIGVFQAPVVASKNGLVVTGLFGATVTGLTLHDNSRSLANTRIAFTTDRDDTGMGYTNFEIYAMNPDGSGLTNLTNNPAADQNPAWSPDGAKFAFSSNREGNFHIYIMNADGSNVVRVTNAVADDDFPAWSPDGAQIAFQSNRSGKNQIYSMNADGSNVVRLTNSSDQDQHPAWSPDGAKIAFDSSAGSNYDIYTIQADGAQRTRLTTEAAYDVLPIWSPDGKKILYSADPDGQRHIYTMNADGSNPAPVTSAPSFNTAATWSPDGTQLALNSLLNGNQEIFTFQLGSPSAVRITNNPAQDLLPVWSPFIRTRTLLGAGGTLGTQSAGFLYGRKGNLVTSVVSFDADRLSGVSLTVLPATGDSDMNLGFALTSPMPITSLKYLNGLNGPATTVIGPGGALNAVTGVIVEFDSVSGYVTSVLPYTGSRVAPTALHEGTAVIYRTAFSGVWDASGKNLAPQGASEVRLDAKTGKILTVR